MLILEKQQRSKNIDFKVWSSWYMNFHWLLRQLPGNEILAEFIGLPITLIARLTVVIYYSISHHAGEKYSNFSSVELMLKKAEHRHYKSFTKGRGDRRKKIIVYSPPTKSLNVCSCSQENIGPADFRKLSGSFFNITQTASPNGLAFIIGKRMFCALKISLCI